MAAFDLAVSRDHAVAGRVALVHVEIEGAVDAQPVDLHKGARVEQDVDAFAGGELSRLVLFLDAVFSAAGEGCLADFQQAGALLAAQGVPVFLRFYGGAAHLFDPGTWRSWGLRHPLTSSSTVGFVLLL